MRISWKNASDSNLELPMEFVYSRTEVCTAARREDDIDVKGLYERSVPSTNLNLNRMLRSKLVIS